MTPNPLADYLSNTTHWAVSVLKNSFLKPESKHYAFLSSDECLQADAALLLHALDSPEPKHCLQCPEWKNDPKAFAAFLATLCLHKYNQNQFLARDEQLYQTGTVLLNPEYKARVVVGRHADGMVTLPVGGRKTKNKANDTLRPTFKQLAHYVPLAGVTEHTYTPGSVGNLRECMAAFSETLADFRALTQFPRRLLVIAQPGTVAELRRLGPFPIRFQGQSDVPVVQPLIEVFADYQEARSLLRTDDTLTDVVVLGDAGYRDCLNDMLTDHGDGYFSRLLLVGAHPVHADSGFVCWPWSRTERTRLRTGQAPDFQRISIQDTRLDAYWQQMLALAPLLTEAGLPAKKAESALRGLFSRYVRDAWVDGDSLHAYHRRLLEDADSEWKQWFDEGGQAGAYPAFCAQLLGLLADVKVHVEANRLKLNELKRLASSGVQTWVVARPKQVAALAPHLAGLPHLKAIAYKDLKQLLAQPAAGTPEQFVFPCLHLHYASPDLLRDFHLYQHALERGNGYLLCHEVVENQFIDLCQWLHRQEENRRLTHPGRLHWVDFACEALPLPEKAQSLPPDIGPLLDDVTPPADEQAALPEALNDFFTTYFGVRRENRPAWKNKARPAKDEEEETPLRRIAPSAGEAGHRYHIRFDKASYECAGSTPVARIQSDDLHNIEIVPPAHLHPGDQIVHFDITLYTCFDTLLTVPDARPILAEVKWGRQAWRDWLRKSIEIEMAAKRCDEPEARLRRYRRIADRLRTQDETDGFVEIIRFGSWLDDKNKPFFPNNPVHLEAILESHLNQLPEPAKSVKRQEMHRIMQARDQRVQFDEIITRLQTEMTGYLIDKRKGTLLRNFTEAHLKRLLATRHDRIVQRVEVFVKDKPSLVPAA